MPSKPPKLSTTLVRQRNQIDERRGSASKRGYDRAWQKVRLLVLRQEPWCRFCIERGKYEPAAEVDHIEPIRRRPDLRLVMDNLRPLCKPCHSRRTAKEQCTPR